MLAPGLASLLEIGGDEIVLRRKVGVQRRLRRAGFLDDLVDTDGTQAPRVKELVGHLHQTISRFHTHDAILPLTDRSVYFLI
jgi:hypothetical protein